MPITAQDLQEMVTHWLGCPPNGYLGSGYGSGVADLLHTPLHGPGADALLAKLRDDIAVMAQLPPDTLNVYSEVVGVDRLDLIFEVAGNFIRLDDVPARPTAPSPKTGAVMTLTPAAVTLVTAADGVPTSYAGAVSTATISYSGVDQTGDWTFSRVNGPGVTSTLVGNVLTINTLAPSLDPNSAYVDVTASNADFAQVTKRFAVIRDIPAAGDPLWPYVVMLMRFDDNLTDERGHGFASDGADTFIDDWIGGRAVSIGGGVGGGGQVIYSTAPSLDFALQGDFCIEASVRINANVTRPRIFVRVDQGGEDVALIGAEGGEFLASIRNGTSSAQAFGGPNFTYGVPVHIAIVREGNTGRLYIDGVLASSSAFMSYRTPNVAANVFMGNNRRFFVDALDGAIAWSRITNHARYTDDFTPPTEP